MKKKLVSALLVSAMAASMLAGCGSTNKDSGNTGDKTGTESASKGDDKAAPAGDGSVYYLNFKPEQDQAWQDLAQAYTDETGVEVTVITAADGTYEQTLK